MRRAMRQIAALGITLFAFACGSSQLNPQQAGDILTQAAEAIPPH